MSSPRSRLCPLACLATIGLVVVGMEYYYGDSPALRPAPRETSKLSVSGQEIAHDLTTRSHRTSTATLVSQYLCTNSSHEGMHTDSESASLPWCLPGVPPPSSSTNSKPGLSAAWHTNDPVLVQVNATKTQIFSAYLDNQLDKTVVVVLGFEDIEENTPLFCLVTFENDSEICLSEPAEKQEIHQAFGQYKAYLYTCKLHKSSDEPQYVMLSIKENCQLQPPNATRIPINYYKPNCMKKFGVCIEGPLFKIRDPQTVAEPLELNRILRVDFFTVYVHIASSEVLQLLQEYAEEDLVDVINWGSEFLFNGSIHYRGQDGLINDCLYRNMHRVKYLLFIDLDEFIIPQRNFMQNLSQLMEELDVGPRASFKMQNVFFYKNDSKLGVGELGGSPLRCESSKQTLKTPRIISFSQRRKYPTPLLARTKCIVKPAFTRMVIVHTPMKRYNLQGYRVYQVPPSIALLHHYRLSPKREDAPLVPDEKMAEYAPALIKALKYRLCQYLSNISCLHNTIQQVY